MGKLKIKKTALPQILNGRRVQRGGAKNAGLNVGTRIAEDAGALSDLDYHCR